MRILPLFCIGAIIFASPLLAEEKKYNLEELSALAEQEEWQEYLAHAKDVSPKVRKGDWQKNLELAAIGVLDDAAKKSPMEAFSWANNLADQFKTLKRSKPYMKHRGEVGLKALNDCFGNRYGAEGCYKAMTLFVQGDPKNVELNYTAGKMARMNMNSSAAVPFFAAAVKNAKGKRQQEICADDQLELAVISALGHPKNYDDVKPSQKLVGTCFKSLKKPVFEAFLAGGSYEATNTCDIWKKKKMLSPFQKAHCKDRGGQK